MLELINNHKYIFSNIYKVGYSFLYQYTAMTKVLGNIKAYSSSVYSLLNCYVLFVPQLNDAISYPYIIGFYWHCTVSSFSWFLTGCYKLSFDIVDVENVCLEGKFLHTVIHWNKTIKCISGCSPMNSLIQEICLVFQ